MTLKPCPFCGGEAELFTDETGLIEVCVECKQCHARTDWSLDWNDRVIPEGYVKVVRCRACKWWNYPWTSEYYTDQGSCSLADIPYPISPDHYCAYGEPKEAGE